MYRPGAKYRQSLFQIDCPKAVAGGFEAQYVILITSKK